MNVLEWIHLWIWVSCMNINIVKHLASLDNTHCGSSISCTLFNVSMLWVFPYIFGLPISVDLQMTINSHMRGVSQSIIYCWKGIDKTYRTMLFVGPFEHHNQFKNLNNFKDLQLHLMRSCKRFICHITS